eukprot:1002109-Prorocentrum_minimum.AAC.4
MVRLSCSEQSNTGQVEARWCWEERVASNSPGADRPCKKYTLTAQRRSPATVCTTVPLSVTLSGEPLDRSDGRDLNQRATDCDNCRAVAKPQNAGLVENLVS